MNFKKSLNLLSVMIFLCLAVNAAAPQPSEPHVSSNRAFKVTPEVIALAGAFLHIPSIFTIDSTNQAAIKLSELAQVASVDTKLFYELFREKNTRLAKEFLLMLPKICAYLVSNLNELHRFVHADAIAEYNAKHKGELFGAKLNQGGQLCIEIVLRALVCYYLYHGIASDNKIIITVLAELADWVEIWRLMSRLDDDVRDQIQAHFNKKDDANVTKKGETTPKNASKI